MSRRRKLGLAKIFKQVMGVDCQNNARLRTLGGLCERSRDTHRFEAVSHSCIFGTDPRVNDAKTVICFGPSSLMVS